MATVSKTLLQFAAISAIVIAATGCEKGIDRHLETGKGKEAFFASVQKAASEITTDREAQAILWSVSVSDADSTNDIHARYPNATLREVIRGEVKRVIDENTQALAALEPKKAASDALLGELKKIVAEDIRFSLERDFFGLQPRISAKVSNRGNLAVSQLRWRAALFVDGRTEPAAVAEPYDSYNETRIAPQILKNFGVARETDRPSKGLLPGVSVNRKFTVGHGLGQDAWKTIEIQNSKQMRVELSIVPSSVKNLSDQQYWGPETSAEYNARKKALDTARSYSDI